MNARKIFAPNLSTVFTIFMLVMYAALAIVLVSTSWPAGLPQTNRIILSIALIAYVVIRGYRLYNKTTNGTAHDNK